MTNRKLMLYRRKNGQKELSESVWSSFVADWNKELTCFLEYKLVTCAVYRYSKW